MTQKKVIVTATALTYLLPDDGPSGQPSDCDEVPVN